MTTLPTRGDYLDPPASGEHVERSSSEPNSASVEYLATSSNILDLEDGWIAVSQKPSGHSKSNIHRGNKSYSRLGIGICVMGMGLMSAMALLRRGDTESLRVYLMVYTTLTIGAGCLLIFSWLFDGSESK
jgi:hypothetical protein